MPQLQWLIQQLPSLPTSKAKARPITTCQGPPQRLSIASFTACRAGGQGA